MRLFVRNFTVLDYAFLCPELGLRGDSYYVSAELSGELDHQGFILDFGRAKKLLKTGIDTLLDHRLALAESMAGLELLQNKQQVSLSFKNWSYEAPLSSITLLPGKEVSMESVVKFLEDSILPSLGANVHKLKITLSSEPLFETAANFRYTHGLKYHDGNCQRLFHGHRNLIEVSVNGMKSALHETELAALLQDVHFVARDNLVNFAALDLSLETRAFQHPGQAQIEYRSSQGNFKGSVPASSIVVLEAEPSIENIAAFAKRTLEKKYRGEVFSVTAYEGLNKGATA